MSSEDKRPEDTAEDAEEETSVEASEKEESLFSAAGAAQTANKAVNKTLDKYLAAVGLDLEDIQGRIREKPILYLAVSAGIGVIAGGGMNSEIRTDAARRGRPPRGKRKRDQFRTTGAAAGLGGRQSFPLVGPWRE